MGELLQFPSNDGVWRRYNKPRRAPLSPGHVAPIRRLNVGFLVDSFAPPERPEPMWDEDDIEAGANDPSAQIKSASKIITPHDIPHASRFQEVFVPLFPDTDA